MIKLCVRCGVEKPSSDFSKRTSSKDGLNNQCRECFKEYRKTIDYKDRYARHGKKDYARRTFGITLDEYNSKMEKGICEICGTNEGRMCLDHCHITNEVRGCLCHKCNTAIGLFDDDIEKMNKAVDYLKRYNIGTRKQNIE